MIITAIQIKRIENSGTKMLGIATVTLDDMIVIHDIKVLKNGDSLFMAMPSRATKANTFKDVVHPINREVRHVFERLIFSAYEKAESMQCVHLELLLRDACRDKRFSELVLDHYENGRVTQQAAFAQQTVSAGAVAAAGNIRQKKQPESKADSDLLKWLEG